MNPKSKPKLKDRYPLSQALDLRPLQFIVYIDGYNLYKGINHEEPPHLLRLGWSNYQKLGERLVDLSFNHSTATRTVKVKYFTAPVDGKDESAAEKACQDLWLDALKVEAPNVEVIPGLHRGPKDNRREKMTDVNIAIAVTRDVATNPAGVVLVSGDLDFRPAVELAAKQGIPVAVFFPQDHELYNVALGADYSKRILTTYLTREIMETVRLVDGRWRDYLTRKIKAHPKFQPCMDYEDRLGKAKLEPRKVSGG